MTIKLAKLASARLQQHTQQTELPSNMFSTQTVAGSSTTSTKRHALNCIIDESAVLASLKEQEDLKKWIRVGAINVYVPISVLEKLNSLRASSPPLNLEARRALEWLDEITTATLHKEAGFVQLQEQQDQFKTWEEVEKYLLPETPLSGRDTLDGLNEAFEKSLELRPARLSSDIDAEGVKYGKASKSASGISTPVNGETGKARDANHAETKLNQSANIPAHIRPLINYTVWRTQYTSIRGTYILFTNDPSTQKLAQKFGVRAKLLNQVRSIIAKEITQLDGAADDEDDAQEDDVIDAVGDMKAVDDRDEEDQVLYNPKSRSSSKDANRAPVIDPNHFGRASPRGLTPTRTPVTTALVPEATPATSMTVSKGQTGSKSASARSPQKTPASPTASSRTPVRQGGNNRQNRNSSRGNRTGGPMRGPARQPQTPIQVPAVVKPIDPDSYARPAVSGVRGGRGGRVSGGRLWEPGTEYKAGVHLQIGSPTETATTADVLMGNTDLVVGQGPRGSTVLIAPREIASRKDFLFTSAKVEIWQNDMKRAYGPFGFGKFVWRTDERLNEDGRRWSFVL